MLPRDRAEMILNMSQAGWSAREIADRLGHAPQTIRGYLNGHRTPGIRSPRPSKITDRIARYCRQRFTEDPHLRPSALFHEVTELGFPASRSTFYRELRQGRLSPPDPKQTLTQQRSIKSAGMSRPFAYTPADISVLPRPVTPVTGETLVSYLTRLANANQLTLSEILTNLHPWFTTKINNGDDRALHHMLVPATTEALRALAHLTDTSPASLSRALPAFGTTDTNSPLRATTACHRCTARRGIQEPVPVHLPVHDKICTRHRIWLSDTDQHHVDVAACPEIITAQHKANRLLRHRTPQQLTLALQAAADTVPAWPASTKAIPFHWRQRLLTLQTTNQHRGIPADHHAYTHAAIYPDAISVAAEILTNRPPA